MNANILTTILSTKKLTPEQKDYFSRSEVLLTDYDAISIEFLNFSIPKEGGNAIFTSQNAVRAVFDNPWKGKTNSRPIFNCFCVGEKTKRLLHDFEQKIVKSEQNALNLANYILKNHKNDSFLFFSGNLRLGEIPTMLNSSKIDFFELKVYKTVLNFVHFEQKFDKILFFSPSGVQSYMKQNTLDDSAAICIGETTAFEAKKYTTNIVVSKERTVEGVLAQALKF